MAKETQKEEIDVQAEFEKAFDEAPDDLAEGETAAAAKDTKEGDEAGEKAEAEEKADGTEDNGDEKGEDTSESQGEKSKETELEDKTQAETIPLEEYRKLEQKYKSVDGMLKSDEFIKKQYESRFGKKDTKDKGDEDINALADKGEEAGDKDKGDIPKVVDLLAEQPAVKALAEDFPDVSAGVSEMIEHVRAETFATFKELFALIKPTIEKDSRSTEEAHIKAIQEVHPDYNKYTNEIVDWIGELPEGKKKKYWQEIVADGTSDEVIELITTFKAAKGYKSNGKGKGEGEKAEDTGDTSLDDEQKEELKKIAGMKKKHTAIKGKGATGSQDYAGAFEEFVSAD